ncbi:MAG: hypothetical protein WC505_04545 [Patescibacteria group bacterium]
MFPLLAVALIASVAVADFTLLTNFKASVLLALGSAAILTATYSLSCSMIGSTAQSEWKGLMLRREWYYVSLKWWLVCICATALFVGPIYLLYYLPKGYDVNIPGIAFGTVALMVGSFLAHLLGTLRGFSVHKRAA